MPARRAFTTKLPWLFAIIAPPALIACLIARYGVDVPYWDDWAMGDFLVKTHAGNRFFRGLRRHPQRRPPRRPAHSRTRIGRADGLGQTLPHVHVTGIRRSHRSLPLQPGTCEERSANPLAGHALLAGVFIFSILQFLNWLWAFQVALFIPATCLAVAMWITTSRISGKAKIVAAALLAFIATYSFTNGMSLWLLLFLLLWITPGVPRKLLGSCIWPTAAAITLLLYFHHFHRVD